MYVHSNVCVRTLYSQLIHTSDSFPSCALPLCVQSYTQYIPLSLYDLQGWMNFPSVYVFDCSLAGRDHTAVCVCVCVCV